MIKYRCLPLICFLSVVSFVFCSCEGTKQAVQEDMIAQRKDRIEGVLKTELPVLALRGNAFMSKDAQREFLSNQEVLREFWVEPNSGRAMLNEVLSIGPLRPSDQSDQSKSCEGESCLRMEIYNYALNGTLILVVHLDNQSLISHSWYPQMQGDLNEELSELALEIAFRDSMVQQSYGSTLKKGDGIMHGTKTALNRTKCQRSRHLCAAPTFIKGEKALWAIVDLTDLQVVGVEWTQVGRAGMPVTERSAQNHYVMQHFCEKENILEKYGWSIRYALTRSDGLKVFNCNYKGQQLVKSIKTVDWHVSYSELKGFGYSDAIGCPEFSMSAVVAVEAPYVEDLIQNSDTIGFVLVQRYHSDDWPLPCSYNYEQRFYFFMDGSFRPAVGSLGRGCGTDGWYRPVTRISLEGQRQVFTASRDGSEWDVWDREDWSRETAIYPYAYDKAFAEWQLSGGQSYRIISNQGQFEDTSRGDQAWFYITVHHPDNDEGESDLPTIGPCCNTDHRQGPEKFINQEPLKGEKLVFWYVPEMKNDGRPGNEYCWAESVLVDGVYVPRVYPCFSGPFFKLDTIQ